MKNAKKKKSPILIVLLTIVAILVVALVVMVAMLMGRSGGESVDPTASTGTLETASQPTTSPAGTENIGKETTTPSNETETVSGEETKPEDTTEQTKATKPTSGSNTEATTPPTTPAAPTSPTAPTAGKEDQTSFQTPYCTLRYPKEWAGFLRVEVKSENPYTVTYYADLESGKQQELFTITFGGSEESALGSLTAGGKTVPVHVSSVDFKPDNTWSDKEINIVYTMQEAMNELLTSIPMQSTSQLPQDEPNLPKEDGEEMVIETAYGELRYPSRWKDYLEVKIESDNGYRVVFCCKISGHETQRLFVVHYGGSQGIAVGSAKDSSGKIVDVRLEVLEINLNDSWSNDEKSIVAAMQEDLNYLLSKLG